MRGGSIPTTATKNNQQMLTIVPTPIGNLEDITFRAIRVLKEAEYILAEDTRTTKRLLQHYQIDTPLRSHHAHNEHGTIPNLIAELENGVNIALVSDAGTPAISDPGFMLSRACMEAGTRQMPRATRRVLWS